MVVVPSIYTCIYISDSPSLHLLTKKENMKTETTTGYRQTRYHITTRGNPTKMEGLQQNTKLEEVKMQTLTRKQSFFRDVKKKKMMKWPA
jgi:hypothetical protein